MAVSIGRSTPKLVLILFAVNIENLSNYLTRSLQISKVCLMSVVENSEISEAYTQTVLSRTVTRVLTVNSTTTGNSFRIRRIHIGTCSYRSDCSESLALSIRRVEGVSLQFGAPGPTATLKGTHRFGSRSTSVPLSTALGLLDSGVRGEIRVTRKQGC